MSTGDIYRVQLRYELFGYAIMNQLHFESVAGFNSAQETAEHFLADFQDQYMFRMSDEQRLRSVYAKRLVGGPSEYTWFGSFPYFHGTSGGAVSDPRLAATIMLKSGLASRQKWNKFFWGALGANMVSGGYLSPDGQSQLEGMMGWFFGRYGPGGSQNLRVGTWSRYSEEFGEEGPLGPWTLSNYAVVSRRIAIIHSRRTGAGL